MQALKDLMELHDAQMATSTIRYLAMLADLPGCRTVEKPGALRLAVTVNCDRVLQLIEKMEGKQ